MTFKKGIVIGDDRDLTLTGCRIKLPDHRRLTLRCHAREGHA